MMTVKDHYRTLGVSATASGDDIKKAYRKLVLRCHPDTNGEDKLLLARFHSIREAYELLSDPEKRKLYDEQRYFSGYRITQEPSAVTGIWLMEKAEKLYAYTAATGAGHMNHKLVHDYIRQLLSADHLAILMEENNKEEDRRLLLRLLQITEKLRYRYFIAVIESLMLLAGSHTELQEKLTISVQQKKQQRVWERYMPLLILFTALLLCMLIYLSGINTPD